MATKFSPCKGSYVLNQFPSNVMFGMNGFHLSASGAIQGHHGPLVACLFVWGFTQYQQYLSYLTATVHKSMFPGQFFNQDLTSPGRPVVVLLP